jgi:hypothetical protein
MSPRSIAVLAALAAIAVGSGFLIGHPAAGAAAAAIVFAAAVSMITTREIADRAELRAPPSRAVDPPPLEQLRRVERALSAAQASEFGVDRELRPLFRPIAAMRLARRGVDLDRHRKEARELLGEQLWDVVRVDRLRGSNRVEGGISAAGLESLIERLERI